MGTKPRKKCAACGKTFSVNKDGTLQKHQGTQPHPLGHKMLSCPGGNSPERKRHIPSWRIAGAG